MITNRHMLLLARLVIAPAAAREDPVHFQRLVRSGLATRTLDIEQRDAGLVTAAGVAALDRWLGRSAGLETGLTRRQAEALRIIEAGAARGVSPSYSELRDELHLSSKSGVHRIVLGLEQRGRVTRLPGRKRSLVSTSPPMPSG